MRGEPDAFDWACDVCGATNSVFVEPAVGARQEFVEDCAVCCRPHTIHVRVDRDGDVEVTAVAQT